jgi:UDP-glucose:(heptosyl)LPS alpha-1,3-glucosyltransferase
MKLSFLIYSYFPFGGQQRDFYRIVSECLQRGHEIDVYTIQWQGDIPDGVNLIKVPVRAFTKIKLYQRFTEWVAIALKKRPTQLTIGFNKMPLLDLYFAADPCFADKAENQRSFYYQYTNRYKHFKRYEEAVFGDVSQTEVMILSPQQRTAFSNHYANCNERLHLVPPGIDCDRIPNLENGAIRKEFREEFDLAENELLILQVGSGFKVKGVDRSLRAFASLPDYMRNISRFLLVGQDKPDRYRKLARQLKVSDRFSILPGREDIPRFLAGADLLLHPAYMESAGYVLLEATIAGLPVLTTATCGYSFHIEEAGSGEVCDEPFDQENLNQKLSSMLQSLNSAEWSENGRKYGENERLFALAEEATDLIEELICARSPVEPSSKGCGV